MLMMVLEGGDDVNGGNDGSGNVNDGAGRW
jgi:hypothetical protein